MEHLLLEILAGMLGGAVYQAVSLRIYRKRPITLHRSARDPRKPGLNLYQDQKDRR